MLKFSCVKGAMIRVETGNQAVVVFPEKPEPVQGALVLLSHPEEQPSKGIISWPGEYDIAGIALRGIGHEQGASVSFVAEMEEARVAFLCSPLPVLTDNEMQLLGDVDVLILPTDDVKIVQKLIDDIDPRVFIPIPGGDAKNYSDVLKLCGVLGQEAVEEFKLKGALPPEGREVVVMSA